MSGLPTLRTIARTFSAYTLRGMAHALSVAPPITAREVIAAFIKASTPRRPDRLRSPQGPLAGDFTLTWHDPSPSYARATKFQLQREYSPGDGSHYTLNDDVPAVSGGGPNTFSAGVPTGTEMSWNVWGVNQYGKGPEAGSADEGPPAPTSPPPPPAPPPPQQQTTTYANIEFWNCYSTSVTQLSFRLVDQTTGDDHTYGPFPYEQNDGGCGPGVTNPAQSNSLVAGHIYAWQVLDDSNNVLLDDSAEGGPVTGGHTGTAQIVYPPS
jgi:hypothetical protein